MHWQRQYSTLSERDVIYKLQGNDYIKVLCWWNKPQERNEVYERNNILKATKKQSYLAILHLKILYPHVPSTWTSSMAFVPLGGERNSSSVKTISPAAWENSLLCSIVMYLNHKTTGVIVYIFRHNCPFACITLELRESLLPLVLGSPFTFLNKETEA